MSGVDKVLRVWDIDEGGRERVLRLENFIDQVYQTNRSWLNVVPMFHCLEVLFISINIIVVEVNPNNEIVSGHWIYYYYRIYS